MPTYEYRCKACGEELEVVQSFRDDSLTTCETCGGQLRKVFGNVGIAFKGSGFYKNDSRGKSSATATGGDKTADAGAGTGSDSGSGSGSGEKSADGVAARTRARRRSRTRRARAPARPPRPTSPRRAPPPPDAFRPRRRTASVGSGFPRLIGPPEARACAGGQFAAPAWH